jgi:hypothetical protein
MMREELDDVVDDLLRDHFRRELDPHVGQAERAVRRGAPAGRRLWLGGWWTAAGALAASVGIVSAIAARMGTAAHQPTPQIVTTMPAPAAGEPVPIEQVVRSQAVDEGPVIVGDAGPARWVREKVVETTTFYDQESKSQVQLTVPKERVMLIGMQTY